MSDLHFQTDPTAEAPAQAQPTGGAAVERRAPWWRQRARLVVVPLDGSDDAKVALAAARLVARLARATIQVIHVVDPPLGSAEELLRQVGLRPDETDGLVVEQTTGEPAEAIAEVASRQRAMLIAMTIRGFFHDREQKVSPVVEAVLQRAPCPVLLLRPELAPQMQGLEPPKRLLLPFDGAPSSAAAIGPALELAESMQIAVDILNVAAQAEPPREPGTLTAPLYIDQAHYEWPAWAQEFASRFSTALGQYRTTTATRVFVRSGDPPEEIIRFAQEEASDLIILEWSGHLDRERGLVIKRVLEEMPCPVLLVQPTEAMTGG
ncbi:MAG: universal stress protein [Chloroflexota bacterium]